MIKKLTLQVLNYDDEIIYSSERTSACNNNCLESNAAGFARILKNYFNNSGKGGFKKIAGLGMETPHTVVAFFTDEPKVTHYEDLEIDAMPEFVNEENITKCITNLTNKGN